MFLQKATARHRCDRVSVCAVHLSPFSLPPCDLTGGSTLQLGREFGPGHAPSAVLGKGRTRQGLLPFGSLGWTISAVAASPLPGKMKISVAEANFSGCWLAALGSSTGRQPWGRARLVVVAVGWGCYWHPPWLPCLLGPLTRPRKALGLQHPLQLLVRVPVPGLRKANITALIFDRVCPQAVQSVETLMDTIWSLASSVCWC